MSEPCSLSVVIRAWNEAASLELLLDALSRQDYPRDKVEIIVVDNGSTDETATVAGSMGAKVVQLPQEEFTYPRSINRGVEAATGEIVILISAHALPMNHQWLSVVSRYFTHPLGLETRIAGIYGVNVPGPMASLGEILTMWPQYWGRRLRGVRTLKKPEAGFFNATNCAFPRALWERHHFNEEWAAGAEDHEWGIWALQQGYDIVLDPDFSVRHSHGLGLINMVRQERYWRRARKPQPFNREELSYRPDLTKR